MFVCLGATALGLGGKLAAMTRNGKDNLPVGGKTIGSTRTGTYKQMLEGRRLVFKWQKVWKKSFEKMAFLMFRHNHPAL